MYIYKIFYWVKTHTPNSKRLKNKMKSDSLQHDSSPSFLLFLIPLGHLCFRFNHLPRVVDGGVGGRYIYTHTHTHICMYTHLWLIHVAVWQKPTQHCKAIIIQVNFFKNLTTKKSFSLYFKKSSISFNTFYESLPFPSFSYSIRFSNFVT